MWADIHVWGKGKSGKTGKAETLSVVAVRVKNTPPNDSANIAAYHSNKIWESLV